MSHKVCLLVLASLVAGCAPTLVQANMANPATRPNQAESTQEYDIGPYKENHRYEVTLGVWTKTAIAARIKLVDIDHCALPKSYTFRLVDDGGTSYPFRSASEPEVKTEPGREGQTLNIAVVAGEFGAVIAPETKTLTVEMRPLSGLYCPKLDFRWNLK